MLLDLIGTRIPRAAAPLLPGLTWRHDDGARTLFLTFDDGPCPTSTPRLLEVLARHEARASFFLLGRAARRRPDLVRALHEAGHTLGQHTDTHPDAWRTPAARLLGEMERATATLEAITGEAVGWMRPPYGHLTPSMLRWCRARGQRVAMWDVMPGDFLSSATPAGVLRRTLRLVRPGSVVVLHEGGRARHVTPPALAEALPRLAGLGYRFAPL